MLCLLYSKANQPYVYIYPLFPGFPSHLGHHRTLSSLSYTVGSHNVLSRFSHVWLFATPWTAACQPPLSMGFSGQEYWSGLLSGDLPNSGIKHSSVYMLIPISQSIPPPLFLLGIHTFVLYICISISLKISSSIPFLWFHICVLIYDTTKVLKNNNTVFFSFWLTSLCMTVSRSIHISANGTTAFLFYGWVILHCIYVPHLLYPFLCWWTFRLLPCSGYYLYPGIFLRLNFCLSHSHTQGWQCMCVTCMVI